MGMLCFLHFNDQRLVLRIILSYWQTHSLTKSLLPQPYTMLGNWQTFSVATDLQSTDVHCHHKPTFCQEIDRLLHCQHRLTIFWGIDRLTLSLQTYTLLENWQTFTLSPQTNNLLGNWQTYTVTTDLHSVRKLTDLNFHHRLTICWGIDRLTLST